MTIDQILTYIPGGVQVEVIEVEDDHITVRDCETGEEFVVSEDDYEDYQ